MPSWLDNGNDPRPGDSEWHLLAKIAGSSLSTANAVGNSMGNLQPNGADQELTVSNSAVGFQTLQSDTTHVMFDIQGAPVRARFVSAPTASEGHLMEIGDSALWSAESANDVEFVRDTTTDAIIFMTEFKQN